MLLYANGFDEPGAVINIDPWWDYGSQGINQGLMIPGRYGVGRAWGTYNTGFSSKHQFVYFINPVPTIFCGMDVSNRDVSGTPSSLWGGTDNYWIRFGRLGATPISFWNDGNGYAMNRNENYNDKNRKGKKGFRRSSAIDGVSSNSFTPKLAKGFPGYLKGFVFERYLPNFFRKIS